MLSNGLNLHSVSSWSCNFLSNRGTGAALRTERTIVELQH